MTEAASGWLESPQLYSKIVNSISWDYPFKANLSQNLQQGEGMLDSKYTVTFTLSPVIDANIL
jgi:hypothetical protein